MRCDELDSLKDAYLDSELETRTTIQIEEHLKSCPGCARLIAHEEKFQRQLHAALNEGEATSSLWLSIEEAVKTSAVSGSRLEELPPPSGQSPRTPHSVLVDVIRTRWRRAPVIWAGLSVWDSATPKARKWAQHDNDQNEHRARAPR